jgi:hypothetical protein
MTATLDDEVADLRRDNSELQQRLDEALAREAATAEILGVINSSPGNLAQVFDAMLDKAAKLCAAEAGALFTYEHEFPAARQRTQRQTRFATDSPLEGDGLELPVPLSRKGLLGLAEGMPERSAGRRD